MIFGEKIIENMKIEWGRKVTCPACVKHLYDMMKSVVTCPYCGYKFDRFESKLIKKDDELDFKLEDDLDSDVVVTHDGDDDIIGAAEEDIDVTKVL